MPDSSRRMVLTVLVEAFGVADARHYVEDNLIPYFVACGFPVMAPTCIMKNAVGDATSRTLACTAQGCPMLLHYSFSLILTDSYRQLAN